MCTRAGETSVRLARLLPQFSDCTDNHHPNRATFVIALIEERIAVRSSDEFSTVAVLFKQQAGRTPYVDGFHEDPSVVVICPTDSSPLERSKCLRVHGLSTSERCQTEPHASSQIRSVGGCYGRLRMR